MSKKEKLIFDKKSSCDGSMFMSGYINLEIKQHNPLGILKIDFDLQEGLPVYLRKGEIKDLIDNLQEAYDLISN